MTKIEQAGYLVSLITIMNSFAASAKQSPTWITEEYTKTYDLFSATVRKENENETRNRPQQLQRDEARANILQGQPSRSGSDRPSDGKSPLGSAPVFGSRYRSPDGNGNNP